MNCIVSLFPPLLLLLLMLWLDSMALIKKKQLLICFLWGVLSVLLVFPVNTILHLSLPGYLTLYIAPVIEETCKACAVLWVVRQRRAIFAIDSAIYGVAVGAGFAMLENIFYLQQYPDMLLGTALVRGMGTAIMHCGAVASTGVILSRIMNRKGNTARYYPLALLPAIALHAFYNALIIPPLLVLPIICCGVTILLMLLFFADEKSISRWLDMELNEEVNLLSAMQRGEFSQTKTGRYLLSIKDQFTPEKFVDMYCYVRIYLEISIRAKRNMMLTEAGFPRPQDADAEELVEEFYALKKQLGKTALIILSPIVKATTTKWKIRSLQ